MKLWLLTATGNWVLSVAMLIILRKRNKRKKKKKRKTKRKNNKKKKQRKRNKSRKRKKMKREEKKKRRGTTTELNYEVVSWDDRKQIVLINCLKKSYNQSLWNPRQNQKTLKKPLKQKTKCRDSGEEEEEGFTVVPFPLVTVDTTPENDCTTPPISILDTPDTDRRTFDTPSPSKDDPSYCPLDTPRSRRELETTGEEPPITRARARNMLQNVNDM